MACHCLYLKNADEFFHLLKSHDPDLVLKMVKCVLSAAKRNKEIIDIFDITFKNTDSMVFSIDKPQYNEFLSNCLNDIAKLDTTEGYELCAEMQKQINKKD